MSARATHRSMALEAALKLLPVSRKLQILDLGSPLGANIEFFGRFPCRLNIRQLEQDLDLDGGEPQTLSLHGLPPQATESETIRFDLVVAWDLLDYLNPETASRMLRAAAPFFDRRTLLYALVNTTGEIPHRPLRFRILDEGHLSYERRGVESRPGPRRTQVQLLGCLPGFQVKRSFLLQNRMQEYLFQFEGN